MLSSLLKESRANFKKHLERNSDQYPQMKDFMNGHRVSLLRTVAGNVEKDFIIRSGKYMTTIAAPPTQKQDGLIVKSESDSSSVKSE